jgi:hypothetical protein
MAPEIVICHYRVRDGATDEFVGLLARHWPVLRELGLVTERPDECLIGHDDRLPGTLIVEIFEWVSADAAGAAHTHPAVSEIWERMGDLCEDRHGRPGMEFPHFRAVDAG